MVSGKQCCIGAQSPCPHRYFLAGMDEDASVYERRIVANSI